MKRIFFLIFLLLIICNFSIAQNDTTVFINRDLLTFDNLDIVEKDEIEIMSASRSAKKVEDLPISVYIVTRDEIQMNGYITLTDVLKSIPGFFVSQPGNGFDGESFLMRGFQGNYYTKIMINNIDISPSVNGITTIASQLPIREAERIEIIFGPASAVYGADATSGVINIITKKPESFNYAQADIVTGTNEYTYLNFAIGGKAGKNQKILEYSIYGSHQVFNDMNIIHENSDVYFPMHYFNMLPDYEKPEALFQFNTLLATDITEQQLTDAGLTFEDIYSYSYLGTYYEPKFSKISQKSDLIGIEFKYKNYNFSYHYMFTQEHSAVGLTPYFYKYNSPENYIANTSHVFAIQHSKTRGKFIFSTNLVYNHFRADNNSSYGLNYLYGYDNDDVYIYQASDDLNFEHLITFAPNQKIEFVAGGTYQYSGNLPTTNISFEQFDVSLYKPFSKTVEYSDLVLGNFGINPIVFSNAGLFAQSYFTLKRFTFILGSRYDKNSLFDGILCNRWAVMLKLGKRLTIRTSRGHSYKAPSAEKQYYSIAFTNLSDNKIIYAFVPNEDLQPEKFRSTEFGLKLKLGANSYLDICTYTSQISNIIQSFQIPPDEINLPNISEGNGSTSIREYKNFEYLSTKLNGFQTSLVFGQLISAINLKAELHYNFSFGEQFVIDQEKLEELNVTNDHLPDDIIAKSATDTMPVTMLPKNFGQLNISFEPTKNSYIKIENILSDEWIKGYLPDLDMADNDYFIIDGYYNLNLVFGYKFGKHFSTYIKVLNLTDAEYGGIDATRTDVDLLYNPQYKRNIRFGINYRFE